MRVARMRRARGTRLGFTMLEILTAMIIVGILLTIAIVRLPITASRSDAGVRIMRAALQAAQRTAIARQSAVIVGIDESASRLRIHEDADADGTVDSGERVRTEPLQEGVVLAGPGTGVNGGGGEAVVGTNLRDRDGLPTVTFRRDGSASSDLEVYLRARTGEDGSWRAVTVSPGTGRVDAWRLSGTEWRRMRP